MFVTSSPAELDASPKQIFLHCICDLLLNENGELDEEKSESHDFCGNVLFA